MKLFATTGFGIEGILKNECTLLGYETYQVAPGAVTYEGDFVESNLCFRTAERVFVVLGEAKVTSFDGLFDIVKEIPFEDFMPKNAAFPVNAKSYKSVLHSLRDIQKIAKKAIVTRLEKAYHIHHFPEDGNEYPIMIRIEKDQMTVLLDTTGVPLHKRGYRVSGKIAPIRENLAAALVLFARFYGKGPFIDPMCGSGTLAIEAAMIAKNMAPGLKRNFLFESWGVDANELRESLHSKIKEPDNELFGFDNNPQAITLAKKNGKNAGVMVQFKVRELEDFETSLRGGTLVTNAPYGERMGTAQQLDDMEALLSEKILTLDTWRLGILLGNGDFSTKYHSRYTKVRKLYNGKLMAYYYQYEPTKRW